MHLNTQVCKGVPNTGADLSRPLSQCIRLLEMPMNPTADRNLQLSNSLQRGLQSARDRSEELFDMCARKHCTTGPSPSATG